MKTIKNKLDSMYELLILWRKYTEVIYLPEGQLNFMNLLEKLDLKPDEVAYKNRMRESDVANRLNMLFGEGSKIDETDAAEADYETVNEGSTSDTSSGIDEENLVKRHEKFEKDEATRVKYGGEGITDLNMQLKASVNVGVKEEEPKS